MSIDIEETALEIIDEYPKNIQTAFQQVVVEDILRLFQKQQPQYKSFKYLGIGGNGLVLKVSNDIAIKIVLVQGQEFLKLQEQLEQEYKYLNSFSSCGYILKVHKMYFLTKIVRKEVQKCYFVLESEACDGNQCLKQRQFNLKKNIFQIRQFIMLLKQNERREQEIQQLRSSQISHASFRCIEFHSLKKYLSSRHKAIQLLNQKKQVKWRDNFETILKQIALHSFIYQKIQQLILDALKLEKQCNKQFHQRAQQQQTFSLYQELNQMIIYLYLKKKGTESYFAPEVYDFQYFLEKSDLIELLIYFVG